MSVSYARFPLGRKVNHDPRSKAYPVKPTTTVLKTTRHASYIDILDQGQVGSCTGNAGVAAIYREPISHEAISHGAISHGGKVTSPWVYTPDETGAVALYTAATTLDDITGTYPAEDTGSDGLSIAKALKSAGIISGYLHAFTLQSALLQLMKTPVITGITWYESMFDGSNKGLLTVEPNSGIAGGHELCIDEYVQGTSYDTSIIGGPNSWGNSWGDNGRWHMTVVDYGHLLDDNGDVTAFVPATQPAPTPIPQDADHILWTAVQHWSTLPHIGANAKAARAISTWGKDKRL